MMINTFDTLIKKKTGLTVEVLTQGYDSKKKLYYSCCVFASVLCYIEITDNGTHTTTICADDKNTITNIKQILASKNNNVIIRNTKDTEYYIYRYMLTCVTQ